MQLERQNALQTIADICSWRPALSSVLQAFSPVLSAQEEVCDRVAQSCHEKGIILPEAEVSRLSLGVSLLSDHDLPDLSWAVQLSFEHQKPALDSIESLRALTDHVQPVLSLAEQKICFSMVCFNSPEQGSELAAKCGLDPLSFSLVMNFVVSAVLHGLVQASFANASEAPWDKNNIWQQGYCPVCGSAPTIAWLDKATIDERNPYLLEGGGRKHLHCGVCGANWRFLRLACPACGIKESKQMEILSEESNNTHGESLYWCNNCRAYCPTVDLRERNAFPNLEAQALGMLHLEVIGAEQNLTPLRRSFWNTFS